jgi:peptidyl-prolyl cis-trans isomerase C
MLAAFLGTALATGAFAEEVNPVVGKVGSFTLREADMDRLISYQSPQLQKQLQENPEQRSELARQILLKKAVADRARKEGFERKPEVKEQLGYVIDDFLARDYLTRVVTANVKVPEEELKKYYKENEKEFQLPEEIKVRHIFVAVAKDAAPEAKEKARAKAEGLLARLKKGEDFAKLAVESSEDSSSAPKGGEIGTISPGGSVDAFEKAAFALKAGELSDVVESPYGFHIIRVDERKAPRLATFDEAKGYIEKKLQGEFQEKKAQEFLEKLAKDSGLEVVGEKAPATPAAPEPAKEPAK